MRKFVLIIASLLISLTLFAAGRTTGKAPSVTAAPMARVSVQRGKAATFELDLRVAPGYHINSNQPHDEYLIPTTLKLDPPSDIAIQGITYPQGHDRSFDFAPEQKINVYSNDVVITGKVRAMRSAAYGTYRVHGELKYQACDNAACYPPKTLPVSFDIRIVRTPRRSR
jgi:Thiol:disulfide interchange protein DsbD, N-terminal